MNLHRVVCVSDREPVCSAADVLAVCHSFPDRNTQSGIGGKLLCVGQQFFLLLEGSYASVERLVTRIQKEAPEAGIRVQQRESAEHRAFSGWSIGDLYLDEIGHADFETAEQLGDLMVDLLAGAQSAEAIEAESIEDEVDTDVAVEDEPQPEPFAQVAAILDRFSTAPAVRQKPARVAAA